MVRVDEAVRAGRAGVQEDKSSGGGESSEHLEFQVCP